MDPQFILSPDRLITMSSARRLANNITRYVALSYQQKLLMHKRLFSFQKKNPKKLLAFNFSPDINVRNEENLNRKVYVKGSILIFYAVK